MKKLSIIAIISVLMLTACGNPQPSPTVDQSGQTTTTSQLEDNKENLSSFLADIACLSVKYNGSIPDNEVQKVNQKYVYDDNEILKKAMEAPGEEVRTMAISKISAQCGSTFAQASIEPGVLLDFLLISLKNAK